MNDTSASCYGHRRGRLVSFRSVLTPSVALVAALFAAPSTAEACSSVPFPDLTLHVDDGERLGVPTDGVIAFRVHALDDVDEALTLHSVEVTQDGTPLRGRSRRSSSGRSSASGRAPISSSSGDPTRRSRARGVGGLVWGMLAIADAWTRRRW